MSESPIASESPFLSEAELREMANPNGIFSKRVQAVSSEVLRLRERLDVASNTIDNAERSLREAGVLEFGSLQQGVRTLAALTRTESEKPEDRDPQPARGGRRAGEGRRADRGWQVTPRKLTPAEVLELLRDMETMRPEQVWAKWPPTIGNVFGLARAALEEALAQKLPAAPVPSDEVIADAIYNADPTKICQVFDRIPGESEESYVKRQTHKALRLLARRIGVQGVPQ